jgi:HEAT repeat protein
LGRLGNKAALALPKLALLVEVKANPPQGDPLHQEYVATAQMIAPGVQSKHDVLKAALKSDIALARGEAVCAFSKMGEESRQALPDLLPLAKDPDFNVRRFLALTLGNLRIKTTETLNVLHSLVEDADTSVRLGAHYGLIMLANGQLNNLHSLLRMLPSEDGFIRFLSAWAVGETGSIDRENALAALAEAARTEPDARNRNMISQAIWKLK